MSRVIIAGSRSCADYELVKKAIEQSNFTITTVISGHAVGVDHLGEHYAKQNNISVEVYPANWSTYGKSAGPIRNKQMAEIADCLIAIWDGQSSGTLNMIKTARKKQLKVFVYNINLDKSN